jgi:hypothetical protein
MQPNAATITAGDLHRVILVLKAVAEFGYGYHAPAGNAPHPMEAMRLAELLEAQMR